MTTTEEILVTSTSTSTNTSSTVNSDYVGYMSAFGVIVLAVVAILLIFRFAKK